jgi:hypothetical protein
MDIDAIVRSIRKRYPRFWRLIEDANGYLVHALFGRTAADIDRNILDCRVPSKDFEFCKLTFGHQDQCLAFLRTLDKDDVYFFRPFDFTKENRTDSREW